MRKTSTVTIAEDGRDKGKTFVVTEMPADQAERWAIRAILGLIQSGVKVPEETLHAGMAGVAALGIMALGAIRWDILEPLLSEMFECVQYRHAGTVNLQPILPGVASQIEEIKTRLALRMAIFDLHLGFSVPVEPPTTGRPKGESEDSDTSTFLESLAGWFRRAARRS
jgi:hypothetical protein